MGKLLTITIEDFSIIISMVCILRMETISYIRFQFMCRMDLIAHSFILSPQTGVPIEINDENLSVSHLKNMGLEKNYLDISLELAWYVKLLFKNWEFQSDFCIVFKKR